MNRLVFELLSFLLLHLSEYLILLDVGSTAYDRIALQTGQLLDRLLLLPAFDARLAIVFIIFECFHGAISVHGAFLGQELLLGIFYVGSEITVQ